MATILVLTATCLINQKFRGGIFYTPQGQSPQLLAVLAGKFDLQPQHFVGLKPLGSTPTPIPTPIPTPTPTPTPPPIPTPTPTPTSTPTPTPTLTPTAAPNQPPTVDSPLNATVSEDDATLQIDLLQGASDADGNTLSVEDVALISGNAVGVIVANNYLTLDPSQYNHLAVGETEVIQYEYSISDGQGGQITQRMTITITGENDVPVAQSDSFQTTLTTLAAVTLTGNLLNDNGSGQDTDPDGDKLEITAVNGTLVGQAIALESGASLTVAADGSFQYDFTDLDALKALGQAEFMTDAVTLVD